MSDECVYWVVTAVNGLILLGITYRTYFGKWRNL